MLIGKFFSFQLWCSEGADRLGQHAIRTGWQNVSDNLKNGADKGALGNSLLGVAKFQSAAGIDKPCYASDFENVLKILIFSTAEAIEKQSVGW